MSSTAVIDAVGGREALGDVLDVEQRSRRCRAWTSERAQLACAAPVSAGGHRRRVAGLRRARRRRPRRRRSTAAIAARERRASSAGVSIGPEADARPARGRSPRDRCRDRHMRWPIHLFSTGRLAHARDALLVHLVVVERAVVGDDEQQRNPVVHRGPQRGRAHQEVAVAADRDRQDAATRAARARRRRAMPGPRADAAAAVGAEEVERMPERPARAVPRQRQVRRAKPARTDSAARSASARSSVRRARRRAGAGTNAPCAVRSVAARDASCRALRAAPAPTASGSAAISKSTGGRPWWSMLQPLCSAWSSDTWMTLRLRLAAARGLQRPGEVDPVERSGSRRPARSPSPSPARSMIAGRVDVQRMVGRETPRRP